MTRTQFVCAAGMLATLAASAAVSEGICVRNAEDARTWQVNLSPDEPIVWAWGAADSAVLTVASAVEKTSRDYAVARTDGEAFGSCAIFLPADVATVEHLLDLTLTLKAGETTLETRSARVVFLPTAFDLKDPAARSWGVMERPKVFAYDAAWGDAPAATASLALAADGAQGLFGLRGTSGFEILDPSILSPGNFAGAFTASLLFDEVSAYSASLRYGLRGLMIFMR